jgi:cellulose biosynthesis protein BcsQ
MSRIYDQLRRLEETQANEDPSCGARPVTWETRPFQVLTVTSNKGGVGKTTLATNLAVYIRAMREDLPILVVGLDDQTVVDRMFALEDPESGQTAASALRLGSFDAAARLGQFGIHYVPTSPRIAELKSEISDPFYLQSVLLRTGWRGLVIIDTKSDLEILTQNAIAASDLTIVVVQDRSSLLEAQKVFDLLPDLNLPRDHARILVSLVDLRIKFRRGDNHDVLGLLLSEIRRRGHPLFETFVSRSPKVESLYTNPEGRAFSILHGARNSLVHRQMRHLAHDVLRVLELLPQPSPSVFLKGLTPEAILALPANPLEIKSFPFFIGRADPHVRNDLAILDEGPWQVSRNHAALIEQDGHVGVVDRGSKLGLFVEGQPLGGEAGESGPIFFSGNGGTLIIGRANSPFRYAVVVSNPLHQAEPEPASTAAESAAAPPPDPEPPAPVDAAADRPRVAARLAR